MKKIVITILILTSYFVQAQKNDEYVSLCKTFGFLHGQESTIRLIKENYPELTSKAQLAEETFAESFGLALEEIDKKLQLVLGDKFDYFVESFEQQAMENVKKSDAISEKNASEFLDSVMERAKGHMSSPILENILHYQYTKNPSEEFTKSYVNFHEVSMLTNDSKVIYTIATPKSWKEISTTFGQSKKFRSNRGFGNEFLQVSVTDIPRERASIDATFEELGGNLYTVSTDIENDPSKDSTFLRGSILYQALNHGIDIRIQCHIYSLNREQLVNDMKKFKPLFDSVVGSIRVEVFTNNTNVLTYKM